MCVKAVLNVKYLQNRSYWFVFYQVWLPAVKAKGLEISGTFSRRQGHMYMDMSFTNKALQHMTDFAVQFNKNRSVKTVEMLTFTSEYMQLIELFGCFSAVSG